MFSNAIYTLNFQSNACEGQHEQLHADWKDKELLIVKKRQKYTIWNKTHIGGVQQMYVVFIVEQSYATCITYYIL
jgi:hypothetical protein